MKFGPCVRRTPRSGSRVRVILRVMVRSGLELRARTQGGFLRAGVRVMNGRHLVMSNLGEEERRPLALLLVEAC